MFYEKNKKNKLVVKTYLKTIKCIWYLKMYTRHAGIVLLLQAKIEIGS